MISLDKLIEVLTYNCTTGEFFWLVTVNPRAQAGDIAGSLSLSGGYIYIQYLGARYLAHRLAWFFRYGYDSEFEIDHVDRVRTHNWPENLREASRQCQVRNCGMLRNNTSGIKGVSPSKIGRNWVVYIKVNGVKKTLGYTDTLLEAAYLRYAAEQCLGFQDCDINSSAKQFIDSY